MSRSLDSRLTLAVVLRPANAGSPRSNEQSPLSIESRNNEKGSLREPLSPTTRKFPSVDQLRAGPPRGVASERQV